MRIVVVAHRSVAAGVPRIPVCILGGVPGLVLVRAGCLIGELPTTGAAVWGDPHRSPPFYLPGPRSAG